MPAKRIGQAKIDGGEALGEMLADVGQIAADVNSRRQEVRQQDHTRRALRDAICPAGLNIWLGEFQKAPLDRAITPPFLSLADDVPQISIGFGMPAAVGNHEQSRRGMQGRSSIRCLHGASLTG